MISEIMCRCDLESPILSKLARLYSNENTVSKYCNMSVIPNFIFPTQTSLSFSLTYPSAYFSIFACLTEMSKLLCLGIFLLQTFLISVKGTALCPDA